MPTRTRAHSHTHTRRTRSLRAPRARRLGPPARRAACRLLAPRTREALRPLQGEPAGRATRGGGQARCGGSGLPHAPPAPQSRARRRVAAPPGRHARFQTVLEPTVGAVAVSPRTVVESSWSKPHLERRHVLRGDVCAQGARGQARGGCAAADDRRRPRRAARCARPASAARRAPLLALFRALRWPARPCGPAAAAGAPSAAARGHSARCGSGGGTCTAGPLCVRARRVLAPLALADCVCPIQPAQRLHQRAPCRSPRSRAA